MTDCLEISGNLQKPAGNLRGRFPNFSINKNWKEAIDKPRFHVNEDGSIRAEPGSLEIDKDVIITEEYDMYFGGVCVSGLNKSVFSILKLKYDEALNNGQKLIEAISISSYNKEINEVESRFVNLKYIINDEFIFFSNYTLFGKYKFFIQNLFLILR